MHHGRQAQRLGVHPQFIGHHAHDRRGQFRAKGELASTLVLEGVELADDARAGLGGEQVQRLEDRRLHAVKAGPAGLVFEQHLQHATSTAGQRTEVSGPPRTLHHVSTWRGPLQEPFVANTSEVGVHHSTAQPSSPGASDGA